MPTSPTLQDEVAFISGVNADGTLPLDSYAAWNPGTIPADYSGGYTLSSKWGANTAGTPGGTIQYYFDPASNWSANEQQQFTAGLAMWSAVANISFAPTQDAASAQITFTRGSNGQASTSGTFTSVSDAGKTGGTTLIQFASAKVSIDTSKSGFGPIDGSFSSYGGYPLLTVLHEEAHAIGLEHAGPYNSTVNEATQQFSAYDSLTWSVMSYIDPRTTSAEYYSQYSVPANWGSTGGYHRVPTTWMPLDILAVQRLYGLPTSTPLSGGQTFGFNCNIAGPIEPFFDFAKNTTPIVTLWDLGANNTLDLSGFSAPETVNLNPGTYSSVDGLTNNIAIAFNTSIDKLVCSAGSNTVTCNNDGDTIVSGIGSDTIFGGSGSDTVIYSGNRSQYTISFNPLNSTTTITSSKGTDSLTGVETAQFADQVVALNTDDYAGSTATTGVVNIGGSTTGSIETAGDTDWFRVTLTAGRAYEFDLQGHSSGNGSLVDPYLWLLDSSGNTLIYNDDVGNGNWDSRITYTPTTSGTYFLDAGSRGGPGTYLISASELLGVGGPQSGAIASSGATERYAVTLTAGQTYEFDVQGHPSGNGTLVDPNEWLRDASGNIISYDDDIGGSNWDSRITYTAASSGTYFVDAGSRGGPGTYQVLASEVLSVGVPLAGAVAGSGAVERYAVTLTAGHSYEFDVQGQSSGNGTLVDPNEWLRDSAGNTISYNDDIGGSNWDSRITYTAASSGIYFLDADSRGGAGTYQVLVSENLPVGSSLSGTNTGSNQRYAVVLTAGHTYEFDVQGQPSGNGTLVDPCEWLRDSAGNAVSYDDDIGGGNWDSRITYTATSSGTYFVDAGSRGGPGTYQVLASEVLPVGGSLSGNNAGSNQRYAVTLTAGHTYEFDVQGHPSGNGTLVDPCEWLRNAAGGIINYSDDISGSNWDSRITYTAGSSGTYFVDAGSRGGPGTYQVLASEVLSVGSSLSGDINAAGETDRFAVTLLAGHTYQFDLQGNPSGHGTLVDPCLWLLNGSSAQLAYNDDVSSGLWDSRISYTATTTGTYFLQAGSRGGPGTYLLAAAMTS